jgi:hypothetical protein
VTGPFGLTGTGEFFPAPERERSRLLEPARPGEHVWITMVTYRVTDETARLAMTQRGHRVNLDMENVAGVYLGCYVCEEIWTERLSHRRCTGEPR